MIDRNLVVEYLEPVLWGRLFKILEILEPAREVAHVLIEEDGYRAFFRGKLFAQGGRAESMEDKFPDADEIRIYTRETIDGFFRAVQGRERFDLDIDAYLQSLYEELAVRIPILSRRKRQGNLWRILEALSRADRVYNIGILQGTDLYFQCILEFRAGKLIRISTSDRYGQDVFDWEKICENVKKEFQEEAVPIMITLERLQEKYAV